MFKEYLLNYIIYNPYSSLNLAHLYQGKRHRATIVLQDPARHIVNYLPLPVQLLYYKT